MFTTIVPIEYFDPKNGQAMNLAQRTAELFKTAEKIRVPELNKTYTKADIAALEADVTQYYDGEKIFTRTTICYSDFEDNHSFQKALSSAFNTFVPPIVMEFSNKEQVDSFVQYFLDEHKNEHSEKRAEAYQGSVYVCKHEAVGLAMNLHAKEIKAIKPENYPITLFIKKEEQLKAFVADYAGIYYVDSKPYNAPKEQETGSFSKRTKVVTAICACVALAFIIPFLSREYKAAMEEKRHDYIMNAVNRLGGTDSRLGLDILSLKGDYNKKEIQAIADAYIDGRIKRYELDDKLLRKIENAGDNQHLRGLDEDFNQDYYGTSTDKKRLPSWIVGRWRAVDMPTKTDWYFTFRENNALDITVYDLNAQYVMKKLHYDSVDISGDGGTLLYGNKGGSVAGTLKIDKKWNQLMTPGGQTLTRTQEQP